MTTATETTAPASPPALKACSNCGAPMHGPFCYACGQPEKGMIRHLASVMHDVLDTVFNIDSRVFRSLFPLYFRPGYLTVEYFAGRRVRYVTPFRLFFFLCLIAIFAIQLALNLGDSDFKWNLDGNNDSIESAQTEADVQKRTAAALVGINTARTAPNMPAAAIESLDKAAAKIQKKSDDRLAYLRARDAARTKGDKPPPDPSDEGEGELSFDGKPWDPTTHPIKVGWLPGFANAELNDMAARAKENIILAKKNPRHLVEAVFARLPWTLGLLMPIFAVLLKILYIFKRRLYMEHLMVALHSHAFIFMSLFLLAMITLLRNWTGTDVPGLGALYNLLRAAVWIWLPLYLFLMQKRVYRQGWIMTFIKYSLIGICYTIIVSFGLVGALLASLALA
ncbi:MAG TPA: DUF3667 domain-containing protein [Rhodanobacteraceae bacterium]|nr:DUF3667 domain-containing protein [Rhodanobacteraceae bacterium]